MGLEFLKYFEGLEDPRIDRRKLHPLEELLLVSLCAVIGGCDDWVEIAEFGRERLDFFRQYLPFENGIASDDTFRRVFSLLNPKSFQECFIAWVQAMRTELGGIIAIDGKTLRRSFSENTKPLHLLSAFSAENRLILGQQAVAEKSNEITAIPALLKLLDIKGSTITVDAMGCQRKIAQQIVEQGGHYVMGLKGNQGTLEKDVKLFFTDNSLTKNLPTFQTVEKDHGRLETRQIKVCSSINWLQESHEWPGLQSLLEITSTREENGKKTTEKRYYISDLMESPERFLYIVRSHWSIENSLHWTLDVIFHEDQCRSRKDHSPANFAMIRHAALNLIRTNKHPKKSIKLSRKKASWSTNALANILK
jgi:predicted transposase YbfD/YdcC